MGNRFKDAAELIDVDFDMHSPVHYSLMVTRPCVPDLDAAGPSEGAPADGAAGVGELERGPVAIRPHFRPMPKPVTIQSRPEPPVEAAHVCNASCVCDLLEAACDCCVCKAKVRDSVTCEVVGMRRKRGFMF